MGPVTPGTEETDGSDSGGLSAAFDLGVLFVHGIGQQAEGETLIRAADALVDHFDIRLGSDGLVELEGVRLKDRDEPAQARLHLSSPRGDAARARQSWLLAESWWAESFQPARFGALVAWALRVLPFATLAHFGARCRSDTIRLGEARGALARVALLLPWLASFALLLLAPLLALVAIVLSVVLAAVALVPVAPLRAPAQWLQSQLAATLGDSAILVASPTNRGAMIEKIRSDLRWLAPQCGKIAVVAHSQGAALAWEALLGRVPPNANLYLSYGSGLKKLLQLRVADRPGGESLNWGWTTAIAEIAAVAFAVATILPPDPGSATAMGIAVGAWLTLLVVGLTPVSVLQVRRDRTPSRWELLLPAATAAAMTLPLLLAWVTEPRWSWHSALVVVVLSGANGWVASGWLLQRFPARTDRARLLGSLLAGLALASTVALSPDALRWQAAACLAIAMTVLAMGLLAAVLDESVAWENVVKALHDRGIAWRDWYARRDPVPAGPIGPLGDDSIPVTNRGQFQRDHTTYWENSDEFVSDIASALAGHAGMPVPSLDTRVRERRRWRVRVLAAARMVAWWCIAATLAWQWSQLGALGSQIVDAARDLIRALPLQIGASAVSVLPAPSSTELPWIGALAVAAPILLVQAALAWWWRRWNGAESRRTVAGAAFQPEKDPTFAWPLVFYLAGVLFFVLPGWAWILALPFGIPLHSGLAQVFRRQAPPAPVE